MAQGQSPTLGETSAGAVCFLARADFWGGEAGLARRAGQSRVALVGAGGWQDGATALRAEARAQFLLLPQGGAGGGGAGGGGGGTAAGRGAGAAGHCAGLGLAWG